MDYLEIKTRKGFQSIFKRILKVSTEIDSESKPGVDAFEKNFPPLQSACQKTT